MLHKINKRQSVSTTEPEEASMVILETRHAVKTKDAQTLGYYMKRRSNKSTDQPELAVLLNDTDSKVEILSFLFPYYDIKKGAQIFGI